MNRPFVIGIAGGSGSGKTFFLNCFLNHFTEDQICLISQDNYYKSINEQPTDKNGWINFDLPQCVDDIKLLEDLNALLAGQTIQKKEYTFNVAENNARTLTVRPAPVILIEGLFIFHFKEIASLLDMRIFIDAKEEVTLNRRLMRDIAERGYSEDMIMYQWQNHVLPAYKKYLLPYKETADKLILNNTSNADDIIAVSEALTEELKAKIYT